MILVLEDEDWRREFFRQKLGVPDANITADPQALVQMLQDRIDAGVGVDAIYLDHDLGIKVMDPYPREVTGRDAAYALSRIKYPCDYIIHSLNPPGAQAMALTLGSVGLRVRRTPFYDLLALWGAPVSYAGQEDAENG
jgi:hypothetical protein